MRAVSQDGLCSGDPEIVARWDAITADQRRREREWVAKLRHDGVKAAHPDDGWVNRERNGIQFCYPQFNDGAGVGDIVALGWPDKHRLVTIAEIEPLMFGGELLLFRENQNDQRRQLPFNASCRARPRYPPHGTVPV